MLWDLFISYKDTNPITVPTLMTSPEPWLLLSYLGLGLLTYEFGGMQASSL